MKFWNIIGAFTVLTCSVIVSFNHSIELAHLGGYSGALAVLAVVAGECTFLLGALNIVYFRLKSESPGGPAKAGFISGLLLILLSNIQAGWGSPIFSPSVTGIIWGVYIPVNLIISESILSKAILQHTKASPEKLGEQLQDIVKTPVGTLETSSLVGEPAEKNLEAPSNPGEPLEEVLETPSEPGEPLAVALQLYQENGGRIPTRRQVMERCPGCKPWRVRIVISQLKDKWRKGVRHGEGYY